MYKFIYPGGVEAYWEPLDIELGIEIVKEVTGKDTSRENPVEVSDVERQRIQKLYEERNTDPVPETPDEPVDEPTITISESDWKLLNAKVDAVDAKDEFQDDLIQEMALILYNNIDSNEPLA